jgi:hypothetical protein
VEGGRGGGNGPSGDAGAQAVDADVNNFQARYIIRHYWEKPVACKDPVYDRWGGPPGGGEPPPTPAKELALAPRGKVALGKVVRSPVPSLGLPGHPPPRRQKK